MHLFFIRFLISSLISSVLIMIILGIKKIFKNHISARWQYNIWFLFLVILIIPFIPQQYLDFSQLNRWSVDLQNKEDHMMTDDSLLNHKAQETLNQEGNLQDFSISVQRSTAAYINFALISIWILGCLIYTSILVIVKLRLNKVKDSIRVLDDVKIIGLFEKCKRELDISKDLIVGESGLVYSSMTFGLKKTYIVFPLVMTHQLSESELYHIFLHELSHYKNKDIIINEVMCFFQIIYWFNPFVRLAFKKMRLDREINCDVSVLQRLKEENYIQYGKTIINCAEKQIQPSFFSITTSIAGTKKEITKRIQKIASYKVENRWMNIKSICIFIFIAILILNKSAAISILGYENKRYDFKATHVVYEDLSSYFGEREGSFVLYDLQADKYAIYNKEKSITRVSPDSTYKIYSALIGLENNVIQVDDSKKGWNGQQYTYEAWNKDQDLSSAIKNSVNWYFQEIDQQVGYDKLQYYLDEIEYGNGDITGGIRDYWQESSLLISPVEQVELLTDLYTDNTLFESTHIAKVKEALKLEENNGAVLSGKTGTGMINDKEVNGWFIGYVEKNGQTYIFATNVQGEENTNGSLATKITLDILSDKNIY
ncbi:MAG: BlaR1 family beta-lactam sensor/signal transducer [Candidatus Cellulosilyticum pullistercoris]|uniref:BlaR1 family beta-lactam sensor/signal transducer n=1 Tax=Candidatus Cellulosilyticum pullistercoris TaxID=2838521 RepID=A0A9E2NNP4_9FIRM|nr:BlaR1 family beta-lactam sensor/signal transducer [Candidatus Cellulosilyticum pullistercoris]